MTIDLIVTCDRPGSLKHPVVPSCGDAPRITRGEGKAATGSELGCERCARSPCQPTPRADSPLVVDTDVDREHQAPDGTIAALTRRHPQCASIRSLRRLTLTAISRRPPVSLANLSKSSPVVSVSTMPRTMLPVLPNPRVFVPISGSVNTAFIEYAVVSLVGISLGRDGTCTIDDVKPSDVLDNDFAAAIRLVVRSGSSTESSVGLVGNPDGVREARHEQLYTPNPSVGRGDRSCCAARSWLQHCCGANPARADNARQVTRLVHSNSTDNDIDIGDAKPR